MSCQGTSHTCYLNRKSVIYTFIFYFHFLLIKLHLYGRDEIGNFFTKRQKFDVYSLRNNYFPTTYPTGRTSSDKAESYKRFVNLFENTESKMLYTPTVAQ